jgi:hypothetical protein
MLMGSPINIPDPNILLSQITTKKTSPRNKKGAKPRELPSGYRQPKDITTAHSFDISKSLNVGDTKSFMEFLDQS